MQTITFPDRRHRLLPDRDVIEFWAAVDGKRVLCRITLEEVIREFRRGSPGTFEDDFRSLRPQIEERARKLILAKRISDN